MLELRAARMEEKREKKEEMKIDAMARRKGSLRRSSSTPEPPAAMRRSSNTPEPPKALQQEPPPVAQPMRRTTTTSLDSLVEGSEDEEFSREATPTVDDAPQPAPYLRRSSTAHALPMPRRSSV
eukprot:675814-Prymnesium_polylepis.1